MPSFTEITGPVLAKVKYHQKGKEVHFQIVGFGQASVFLCHSWNSRISMNEKGSYYSVPGVGGVNWICSDGRAFSPQFEDSEMDYLRAASIRNSWGGLSFWMESRFEVHVEWNWDFCVIVTWMIPLLCGARSSIRQWTCDSPSTSSR
jgi:hypothetical protein